MSTEPETPEQRVAKRKAHRKSRNGCSQCKQRHSKCNEAHPRCANCIRLDIHCTWPGRERFSSNYPTPPESHGPPLVESHATANPDFSIDTFGSDLTMADLRLLHHWTSKTYEAMTSEAQRQRAWQVEYVEISLDHPFLLRGILALAAVHKVLSDPHADRTSLLLQADSHMSKALATYRKNLEQPRVETAIPMFLLSTMLVPYNLGSAQLETPEDPINAIYQCFRLVQGVSVVVQPHWDQVSSSKTFIDMVERGPEPQGEEQEVAEILRLKKLAETKRTTATEESYTSVIDELHSVFIRTRHCHQERDQVGLAFGWTAHLSEEFLRLISIHDPIAVLILAHFAALLSECRPNWWIREWPQRIVFATQKLLMSTPELIDYLDWPLQRVSANP